MILLYGQNQNKVRPSKKSCPSISCIIISHNGGSIRPTTVRYTCTQKIHRDISKTETIDSSLLSPSIPTLFYSKHNFRYKNTHTDCGKIFFYLLRQNNFALEKNFSTRQFLKKAG